MIDLVVEKLSGEHRVEAFDCGVRALDDWLRRYALKSQANDGCVTYVVVDRGRVVAFHALVVGTVERSAAPDPLTRGLGKYPVPVILVARLGVDRACQGRGLGAGLLRDALLRCASAADVVGAKAVVVVDAKDGAVEFYQRYACTPFPGDSHRLYVTLATVRASLGPPRRGR